jgi:DNA-binding NarL/FixJ family response regulator
MPDLLLIDVDPERPSIVARLSERYPEAAQVLLLDSPAAWRRFNLPSDRPRAVLLKEASAAEIGAALHAVAQGLVVLAPSIARQQGPLAATLPRDDDGAETLTERERQVLELLALGLPNKTIAAELGISEHTAKFHVAAIMSKLGAASRTEAVAVAARRGVLVL